MSAPVRKPNSLSLGLHKFAEILCGTSVAECVLDRTGLLGGLYGQGKISNSTF
jgi:hypothetical protein